MTPTKQDCEVGLKHGQFYIKPDKDKPDKILVDSLKQEDYAEGWKMILPTLHKNITTHHFSIYLSNLPPHLWNKLHRGEENYYNDIRDNIYTYSVKISKYDDELFELYKYINFNVKGPFNIDKISKHFITLQNARIKGWIMTRAYNILQEYYRKEI